MSASSTPAGNPLLFICASQVEVERHPWLYTDEYGQQVGGFIKEFVNIAFVTIKVNLVGASADLLDPGGELGGMGSSR